MRQTGSTPEIHQCNTNIILEVPKNYNTDILIIHHTLVHTVLDWCYYTGNTSIT